jgi:integrase
VEAVTAYLADKPKALPRTPLFTQQDGEPYSRTQIQRAWRKAAKGLGLEQFHLYDLRHAGLTLAAQGGATVRELVDRAGHSTSAAAMRLSARCGGARSDHRRGHECCS